MCAERAVLADGYHRWNICYTSRLTNPEEYAKISVISVEICDVRRNFYWYFIAPAPGRPVAGRRLMDNASFIRLIQNAALLLAVAFIFDVVATRWRTGQTSFLQIPVGLILGIVGISVMLTPWTFRPGIIFDTRSVLLGISGLFFGSLPTAIAMAITAAFRVYQGGVAAVTGVCVILASGGIGIAWRYFWRRPLHEITWRDLYLLGLLIHVVMLLLMFTLPWETALRVLSSIAFPVLAIFPVATTLLGALIINRLRRERSERVLAKSEEKFRKAFYTSPDAVNINRLEDGMYVSINRGFTKIMGYTEEDIIGKTSLEYNIWDDPGDRQRLVAGLQKNGEVTNLEAVFRMKGGDIRYGLMSASVIELSGVPHILSITRDITERKRMEEALRESENKYRLLADNVNDVIFVLDMDLHYTYISPSVKILRGYEPEELLGQPASQTVPPSSWEVATRALAEVLEPEKSTGPVETPVYRTLQLEMRRRDGTTVWTEVKLSFIRDEKQQPVGILGVTRDITDRKRSEEELRHSEAFLNKIIEESPNPMWISDANGTLIRINQACCDLLNITADEVVGTYNVLKDNLIAEQGLLPLVNSVFEEGRSVRFDMAYQTSQLKQLKLQGESSVVLNVTIFPIRESDKKISNAVIQHIDITDRKRAEEALLDTTERLKESLAGTVQVISTVAEARDPYTAGHQRRVSDLARMIASEMGLSSDRVDFVRVAASIHDIGKIAVPSEILSKPAKLTDVEFSLVKGHPQAGYDILRDIEFPWPVAEVILQHHERVDGSGYPNGLTGDEILLEARILSVADVVEAIASHRPYRSALGIDAALEEISENRGIRYDPDAVDACLRLFHEKGYCFP